MKKLTFAFLLMIFLLSACGTDYKSEMVGKWYQLGYDYASLVLYSNGTAFSLDYGDCSWSVDAEGNLEIAGREMKVDSITKDKMVIDWDGDKTIYTSTPQKME